MSASRLYSAFVAVIVGRDIVAAPKPTRAPRRLAASLRLALQLAARAYRQALYCTVVGVAVQDHSPRQLEIKASPANVTTSVHSGDTQLSWKVRRGHVGISSELKVLKVLLTIRLQAQGAHRSINTASVMATILLIVCTSAALDASSHSLNESRYAAIPRGHHEVPWTHLRFGGHVRNLT